MINNWDDVVETSYVTEEGRYTFKVMDYEANTSANGNEYDSYVCQTKDGEQLKVSLYRTDKAMWKYKAFVKALGVPTTGGINWDTLPKSLIGKKFIGEVTKRPVEKINPETGEQIIKEYCEISKFYPVED